MTLFQQEVPLTLTEPIATLSQQEIPFSIRAATEEDVRGIQRLLKPFEDQRKLLRRTRAEIAALAVNGFVAVADDVVVGFAAVEIYSRKLGEIQCLAVADGFQSRGIGSQLVKLCVERAREKGILEVMAISSSEHFLQKIGFDYSLPDQKRALFFQLRSREEFSRDSQVDEEEDDS